MERIVKYIKPDRISSIFAKTFEMTSVKACLLDSSLRVIAGNISLPDGFMHIISSLTLLDEQYVHASFDKRDYLIRPIIIEHTQLYFILSPGGRKGKIKADVIDFFDNIIDLIIEQLKTQISNGEIAGQYQHAMSKLRVFSSGYWLYDEHSGDLLLSLSTLEKLGYKGGRKDGLRILPEQIFHPEDFPLILRSAEDTIENESHHELEIRLKANSNDYLWFKCSVRLINQPGSHTEVIGALYDINAIKAKELTLKRELNRLNTINSELIKDTLYKNSPKNIVNLNDTTSTQVCDSHIDLPVLGSSIAAFNKVTGTRSTVYGINGEVLIKTGGSPGFCNQIIRAAHRGLSSCSHIEDQIRTSGPHNVQIGKCPGDFLWYAVRGIILNGKLVATWVISHVLDKKIAPSKIHSYIEKIGADQQNYRRLLSDMPMMTDKEFENVALLMDRTAKNISDVFAGNATLAEQKEEGKRLMEQLNKQGSELKDILDKMPLPIQLFNSNNAVDFVNLEFTRMFGYELPDIVSPRDWVQKAYPDETYREELFKDWLEDKVNLDKTGLTQSREVFITDKMGNERRLKGMISKLGSLVLVAYFDLDKRDLELAKLKSELTNMTTIFDGIDENIVVIDPKNYQILYMNHAAQMVFGRDWDSKCHKIMFDKEEPCEFCTNSLVMGSFRSKTFDYEIANEKLNKKFRCYDRAIKWEKNKYAKFQIAIDITEQVNIQEQLAESEKLTKTTINAMDDLICVLQKDLTITLYNRAFSGFISKKGLLYSEIIGQKINKILPEFSANISHLTDSVFKSRLVAMDEITIGYDKSLKYYEVRLIPFGDSDDINYAVLVAREITTRKQAEIDREKLITELELKKNEMQQFVYSVSHDLKSPLISIDGFLGFLREDIERDQLDKVSEDIQRVQFATDIMKERLDGLLALSRAGKPIDNPTAVPLSEMIEKVTELLNGPIREHNATIITDDNLPVLMVDKLRFLDVIQNLIENSLKFSDDDKAPVINIGYNFDTNEICFADNGIGILPDLADKIFDIFYKGRSSNPGTGLGLSIVRRIINTHGGSIRAESDGAGCGARFYINIPKA